MCFCVLMFVCVWHHVVFWFQSHQEKDAACGQHLHCSHVHHVLPGCPFWIPNFLWWGLVLLPLWNLLSLPTYRPNFNLFVLFYCFILASDKLWRICSCISTFFIFLYLFHCESCYDCDAPAPSSGHVLDRTTVICTANEIYCTEKVSLFMKVYLQ